MGDITEGIGAAIEGALAGRAVEPRHGEGSAPTAPGEGGETTCLNCGTELIGRHCHQCGQKRHVHRSITAIMHDLVHGVLHLLDYDHEADAQAQIMETLEVRILAELGVENPYN